MNQTEQKAFVKTCLERLYQRLERQDPEGPRSCGVPEEMRAGLVNSDGWCKWKLIPSSVTDADVEALEKQIGCALPSLLRTLFSTCCHFFDDFDEEYLGRNTPEAPFESLLNAWNPTLVRAGFLPFLWDKDGGCIRCIDLANMPDEERCPVVEIDHEVLFRFDEDASREQLLPALEPVSENLQQFLEEMFAATPAGLARTYFKGLRRAYWDAEAYEEWDDFEETVHGANPEDLERLRAVYPDVPESLLALLRLVDGTYYRKYGDQTVTFYFLGSDYEEYPYYLLSARQMVETKDDFSEWGDYLITREYDDIPVDEGICDDMDKLCLLHFSDCMNNGGSSQLFIDFSPSPKGKKGQILRYMHDPDELVVIADSFDGYLRMLMDSGFDFINEDTVDE